MNVLCEVKGCEVVVVALGGGAIFLSRVVLVLSSEGYCRKT